MPKKEDKRKIKTASKYDDFEMSNSTQKKEEKRSSKTARGLKARAATSSHTFFSAPKKKKSGSKIKSENTRVTKKYLQELGIDNMGIKDYIPSSADKTELVCVKRVSLLKKHNGRGLFTRVRIPAGTYIGNYTGRIFTSQKEFDQYFEQNPTADNSYTMSVGSKFVDAVTQGNFTRYINFSDVQDNAEFVEGVHNGLKIPKVMTTKEIPENTQILIDYNKPGSSDYYFLNPEDGLYSASELHKIYSGHYTLMRMTIDIAALKLKEGNHLCATIIGKTILENKLLSDLKDLSEPAVVDLLFLKTDDLKTILDFDETDNFTPLMLACYTGQSENVQWLLQYNVNVNRQQHHSGNCPLFFALEGYAVAEGSEKAEYIKIMQMLIKSKANIYVHDRDGRTFLHKASAVLSDEDFESIISFISKQDHIVIHDIFSYIDKDDFDVLLYCIKSKSLEKVKTLFLLFPDYFYFNFNSKNKQSNQSFFNEFKDSIQDYSSEEKEQLLKLLSNKKYNVSSKLLSELSPSSAENSDNETEFKFS